MAEASGAPPRSKTLSYRYEAYTTEQKLVKGTISASSEFVAGQALVDEGLRPISIKLVSSQFSVEKMFPTLFAVKPREVIVFSRQLATLLESGVSLLPALELLQGQVAGKGFRMVLGSMIEGIRTGKSFSAVVAEHPTVFNEIFVRTISMGELAGKQETTLRQLASFMEKRGELNKKLSGALTYPAIVLGIAAVVTLILITVVLPPLTDMFESMDIDLPITTRILIGTSDFVLAYQLYLFAGTILVLVVGGYYFSRPNGRRLLDRMRFSVPLLGYPMHIGEMGRISRTISMLLEAGLPLQDIMEILPGTSSNYLIRGSLTKLHQGLLLGEGLAGPMAKDDLFPDMMVQMVAVGEESNSLDSSLRVIADLYEATAEERLNAFASMITPLSTVFIGAMAGFIALSIVMPIYSITGSIG